MDDFVIDATAAFRKAAVLAAAPKVIQGEMKRAADRCGVLFQGRARTAAAKKTRHMARSIGFVVSASAVTTETRVFCNVPYAKAQDTGSEPHVIRPKNGKVLAWKGTAIYGPILTKSGGSRALKSGQRRSAGMIFARSVNHPGTKGNRFFTGSFQDLKPRFQKEFAAVPQRVIAAIRVA